MSPETKEKVYAAIRNNVVDARIKLKLPDKEDVIVAQIETNIWSDLKKVLNLK